MGRSRVRRRRPIAWLVCRAVKDTQYCTGSGRCGRDGNCAIHRRRRSVPKQYQPVENRFVVHLSERKPPTLDLVGQFGLTEGLHQLLPSQ